MPPIPYRDISRLVAEGKTKSQFAIPNGKHLGDFFFITDENHKILMAFCWDGEKWIHEHTNIPIEITKEQS